ncbi:MAG TPA: HAMP domain-containing histidine kinase [Sulfurospirillum arcachonense]|nr:HAMP domain-containing histidine kinase [Sulfurospirillum arcachonense]HIP45156.1 HAMP domain-containing histidine kinase [Sulfurospirillum arcachonense]
MNSQERKALVSFLAIYILSAMVLVSIIGVFYYNKEIVSIDNQCSIEMSNKAMWIEKELMHAQMENKEYKFNTNSKTLSVGLFDKDGNVLHSNLDTKKIYLSKKAYKNNTHEYHIDRLKTPLLDVSYIVVEGSEGAKEKFKLIILIGLVVLASVVFIGFTGYFLSRLLIAPIKSRMEKLNCFIKDSAHDINTPVSALMMSVSSLKAKGDIDKRVVNHISISAKLISQIYNSLSFIAFNDKDEVLDEEFDLSELVRESVRFFDEIAGMRGNVILCELEPTTINMDRSRIQKVINNLISNALKYSYAKTEVKIVLKNHIFSIEDKGIGIAEDDQKAIFDRYERKSKEIGGFGIGLDIVKSVCYTYGIDIKLESKLKEETTFYLKFPTK